MTNMVNMQVMVQKVTDVARVQIDQQQMNIQRQAEFAQQIQDQTSKMANTIAQPNQNEKAFIQDKQEQEKAKKQKKKGQAQNEPTEDKEDGNIITIKTTPHKIDITI